MPATFDDLQTRPDDFPVECARHRQRCDGVVFAPKDQRGNPKSVELPVELLPWISEGFQHAADGVTVASLEVLRVSEINERGDGYTIRSVLETHANPWEK